MHSRFQFVVREDGTPFFWLGDTGWYIWNLNRTDAEFYLADRAPKGFNVVQIDCG